MARVEIKNVTKSFGATEVLKGLDIDISHGEFVALLGASGCGKSTLLRCIAGLEDLGGGDIRFGNKSVINIAPSKRGAAMVFQSYALYPHKTVAENMGFALRIDGTPKPEIERKVGEAAKILGITPLLNKRPRQLSGGQRQRVAIGRAIVRAPEVFLFDEPLSNLDAELRARMRVELTRLHRRLDATMIYVTHDQVEAMTMADRIVVMEGGHIQQIGTPDDVYARPANIYVAQFIGTPKMNVFKLSSYLHLQKQLPSAVANGGIPHTIGIRPEDIREDASGALKIGATLELSESLGRERLYHGSTVAGDELTIASHKEMSLQVGQPTTVSFNRGQVHMFDEKGIRLDF
ncbi:MAG: ABC transporter ATP-binding protein [Rhodobacteraceae bacterium]|nr:ABC transporter ATP-binding protein [Paracoccaceae bacterium]MCY4197110.1 ABC transporter ATP-binding protein [Paracoccaceae bacterium]MCY4327473.1 ABC transporter ATP-binding protein [Paracoccaceae bacterium]